MPLDERNAYIVRGFLLMACDHLFLVWHLKTDAAQQQVEVAQALNYLNEALRHMGLMAIEAPPAGQDRSIGMRAGDIE